MGGIRREKPPPNGTQLGPAQAIARPIVGPLCLNFLVGAVCHAHRPPSSDRGLPGLLETRLIATLTRLLNAIQRSRTKPHSHNQTVAAERIYALIAHFQSRIDTKQLVRIQ